MPRVDENQLRRSFYHVTPVYSHRIESMRVVGNEGHVIFTIGASGSTQKDGVDVGLLTLFWIFEG